MRTGNVVTVLDIGSTKVCCCISNLLEDGSYKIIGVGYCACSGVKSGIIVDMRSVTKSIANAVENAEKMANIRVKSVYVSISGKNINSKIVNMSLKAGGRIIENEDLLSLFDHCKGRDGDNIIIHSIPILYKIDSLNGIKDPVGMFADVLNVNVNLVSVPKGQLNNLLICLSRCHLEPIGIVAAIYAAGLSVMDEENASGNQIVIDFGGGTTSIGFFYNGIFCGMEVVPIGGQNITNDIAYGLNISIANAERLKTLHGAAFVSIHDESDTIFAPVIEEDDVINLQQITKSVLNQIIQPRVEEILGIVKKSIENSNFAQDFSRSVVITGGGSMLTGIRDLACGVLDKKIKVKKNDNFIDGCDVQIDNNFAVVVGMIRFAYFNENYSMKTKRSAKKVGKIGFFKKTLAWIENNL